MPQERDLHPEHRRVHRHVADRVHDRRRVEEHLQQDRDEVLHVAEVDVDTPTASSPMPNTKTVSIATSTSTTGIHGSTMLPTSSRIAHEHAELDEHRDDERRDGRRRHEQLAGEVDLLDQVPVADQ